MGCAASSPAPAPALPENPPGALPWLPARVRGAGSIDAWNSADGQRCTLLRSLAATCMATTVSEALEEVRALTTLGNGSLNLMAYAYMRFLYAKSPELYYATLLAKPSELLPVVYTPTVGLACQNFGKMPFYRRGCYLGVADKGHFKAILQAYAASELTKMSGSKYVVDCLVFSDGGRILGLGDLAAWGMGIPIGKLDLYTVCAGVDPSATLPLILDAGAFDASGNTDQLLVRDHESYTGDPRPRVTHTSEAGTLVNSCFYGDGNLIAELMEAATELFVSSVGGSPLLQFEDFNSNDAFPLLAEYREKYLTYNDDIQGTAAVAVAALLGALRIRSGGGSSPSSTVAAQASLNAELQSHVFLFHGAGSANVGAAALLVNEAGVPREQVFMTNSRGVIWQSADGKSGTFRNAEQQQFAQLGEPSGYDPTDLVSTITHLKPTVLCGAVGRAPGCFSKAVVQALVAAQTGGGRPVVFALSNPKTQAEISAADAYTWSDGRVIYGSGTAFGEVTLSGKRFTPGQVNNFYIFPGLSFGASSCDAKTIPERLFMVAAEAVANSLSDEEVALDRVVPHPDRIRECSLSVATAVVLEAQRLELARHPLGEGDAEVRAKLQSMMWSPSGELLHKL